jgi:hypothetical protein
VKIQVQDRSNYLKGLLIIARRDNVLTESEGKIIRSIANKLGFSSDFYEETLKNLLANEYLTEEPIKFSDEEISRSFIIDGLRLAHSDNDLDECELRWLKLTAKENNIDMKWFEKKVSESESKPKDLFDTDFALFSLI